MSILKRTLASRATRLGLAVGVAAAATLTIMPNAQAAITVTLSPATGGATAGQVITVTGSGFKTAAGAAVAKTAYFDTASSCTAFASKGTGTSTAASKFSVVSATKAVVTAPTLTAGATVAAPKAYLLCIYTASATHGSGSYKVYPAATIAASNPIVPAKGSAVGGNTVTVTGTNFTAKTTATLGGNALTGIKVATDGTSFTAKAPAHAASATAVDLVVTTEGGKVTANGTSEYTYTNAITVSPTTAVKSDLTTLTITGLGFTGITAWSDNTSSTTADDTASEGHVYLVAGEYDQTDDGNSAKTLGQTHECVNVQVVSDTELTCDLTGATAALTNGSYTVAIVDDGAMDATLTYETVVSSSATFTVADF